MIEPWDATAMWDKARLFMNHAMDASEPRSFDERSLWASLALELLGKAALSRRSPLLIASPNEDGSNLLAATGLGPKTDKFTTIAASTVWKRCAIAFRPFDARKAGQISNARNEYLHGAAATFSSIPEAAWWPQFWAQAVILVHAQDQELSEFVGSDRVNVVDAHLAQNTRNVEHRATMLVARAAQLFAQIDAGDAPVNVVRDWERRYRGQGAFLYNADGECPACHSTGTVEGDDVIEQEMEYEQLGPDDWTAWANITVGSEYFSCPKCHLVLDEAEVLSAAGVADTFATTGDPADFYDETDYGND